MIERQINLFVWVLVLQHYISLEAPASSPYFKAVVIVYKIYFMTG